jgi:DNA-binding NarL/FixJ family response regulator
MRVSSLNLLSPDADSVSFSQRFLTLIPVIERYAKFAFRQLPDFEREECRAEAVASGYRSYLRLLARGRDPHGFPSLLATRAVQGVKSGRRVGARFNGKDVLSRVAQKRRGFRIYSLNASREREPATWKDAVTDNAQTPPPDAAAFRCDFPAWLKTLGHRERQIAELLSLGHTTKWLARRFGLSAGRVSQLRSELHAAWQRFHGELGLETV